MTYRGVVAAGHEETADAAAVTLRAGGNAYDAACAALAMACVAEPVLASLGGGGFLLAHDQDGASTVYDFFAQTPRQRRRGEIDFRAVNADFGTVTQEFHIGLGAVATPGMIRGLATVHRERGRLPLTEILAPAIQRARDGVGVTAFQADLFQVVSPIYTTESARGCFGGFKGKGGLPPQGAVMRQPDLADSLTLLAAEGDRPFYEGDVAQRLAQMCADGGGHLGANDLAGYTVLRRKPLALRHGSATIETNPPPSFGGTLIALSLCLIERAGLRPEDHDSAHHLGALVQAMVATNKARVDSGLAGGTFDKALSQLLDPKFVRAYQAAVPNRPATARGTTHISVLDAEGNAASMSLSNGEGCGVVLPGTGIMPNNMLGEEDINPAGFDNWATDRRIASMMSPSLVAWPDGRMAALGSGGSNRIRTAIFQVLVNLLDLELPLKEAVTRPRLHEEGGRLDIEPGLPDLAVRAAIRRVPQHKLWSGTNLFFGGVHAAMAGPDESQAGGVGDPRRAGVALVVR